MTPRAAAQLVAGVGLLAGCVTNLPSPVVGFDSIEVTLVSPGEGMRGTEEDPITASEVIVDLRAIDAKGRAITVQEDLDVDVFISFGGNKVGELTACGRDKDKRALKKIRLTKGVAKGEKIQLTRAYGVASLWVEEHVDRNPDGTFVGGKAPRGYGASPEMVFASPTIPDVVTPLSLTAPTATYCVPLAGQQVNIVRATGTGKLVVTSVFTNAYVVTDTGVPYDEVNHTGGFASLYVFTFGRPPFYILPGRVMNQVEGNLTKFVGFTELSFPRQSPISTMDIVTLPPPVELTANYRSQHAWLLPLTASVVKTTAQVCTIDTESDDWKKYNQFRVKYGDAICDPFTTFTVALPGKKLGEFDPLANINRSITVTGMLRNSSGQNEATSPPTPCTMEPDDPVCAALGTPKCVEGTCKRGAYNFWSIVPRDAADIVVN